MAKLRNSSGEKCDVRFELVIPASLKRDLYGEAASRGRSAASLTREALRSIVTVAPRAVDG